MTNTTLSRDSVFTHDQAELLATRKGEPEWLRVRRLQAQERFAAAPMPSTREETWRYTDIAEFLDLGAVEFAAERKPVGGLSELPGDLGVAVGAVENYAGRLVQVDASVVMRELSEDLRNQGVIFTSLDVAVQEHEDLVSKHLGSAITERDGKFADLAAAFWSGGTFLYVPEGVRVEEPFRVWRTITHGGSATFPHTLIVAEEDAEVSVIDHLVSNDFAETTLNTGATEIVTGENARVNYVPVQRWGKGVVHLSTDRIVAGRDARVTSLHVTLGGSVTRVDAQCLLNGPGSHVDLLGLYLAEGTQHIDHETLQDHVSPHAASNLLFKGALRDEGRGVFRGMIRVHPKAQRTNAYQTNRNLLLSPHARADSLPNLEIGADDVRCSHAATVGQLDEEEMFYLRSRGIPKEEATRLVVFGFFGEVLQQFPLEEVRRELYDLVAAKLLRTRA